MLKLSKKSDYGLIFLSYLKEKKDLTPLSKIIEETKLPKRFLARIASSLKNAGLITSIEGKNGGYQITTQTKEVSFYDYLRIFEKNLFLCHCHNENCRYLKICRHRKKFEEKVSNFLINQFKKIKLWQLID